MFDEEREMTMVQKVTLVLYVMAWAVIFFDIVFWRP